MLKPGVTMLQETKLYRKGQIKIPNFCVFENLRAQGEGGGLLTMVHENFEPVLIPSTGPPKSTENILVVEAYLGKSRIRYINAYGVQENATLTDKTGFYSALDQEIENAFSNNCYMCLQMDANGKLGKEIIHGDPYEISPNGMLLSDLISRKSLVVINATDKCYGLITRMRVKGKVTEKSVIDYFIVCQELYRLVISMSIDEDRKYVLKRYYKYKQQTKVVESDHNVQILEISCPWEVKVSKPKTEIFNLRNKKCQQEFFLNTNKSNVLTRCLEGRDVLTAGKNWMKCMKTIIIKSFRKIRITGKQSNTQNILTSTNRISDDQISEEIFERNRRVILDQISEMSDSSGNMSRVKMWKIKQKLCPKNSDSVPVAKKDKYGNLVSNRKQLKDLYVDVYKDRLRHRNIRPEYKQMKENKEYLFNLRLNLSKVRKTPDWTKPDLLKVLKKLKMNKASDPMGLVNELFKPGVAGSDLVNSVLTLCNMIKSELRIPKFVELTNITSIYKNKGSKLDLNNDRGIFTVTCLRSIIDKLIYDEYYETIDGNMSDSNVGGRKKRSIRDHLFIVYGIINNAIQNKINVDLSLYDIAKCFDSQWYSETMNDLWDVGLRDDKFAIISELNSKCNIAIRTPVGLTERFEMTNIEMQGTVMGPLKCSVQLDTLGRECYERQEGLYLYNGCVSVPPLQMIDDLASFSTCSPQTIITNAIINGKIEAKKLEFGQDKCINIHIGDKQSYCDGLKVHEETMKQKNYETYLGEVISSSGSNERNIEKRRNSAIGSVSQMISTLSRVTLGHFHFEIALIFRDSMLISKLVSSSESWYNVKEEQYRKLEEIDEMFLTKIFELPQSVPKLSLYAESGKYPLRFIILVRRLMFWWDIVNKGEEELVHKFYLAQKLKPVKNDFVLQIVEDLDEIGLVVTENEVKKISRQKFKKIVEYKVGIHVRKYFQKMKKSKTNHLVFGEKITAAKYLTSKKLSVAEIQTLFRLRSRTVNVKDNQKSSFKDNPWCRTCLLFNETQEHILYCSEIRSKVKHLDLDFNAVEHSMIYSSLDKQEKVAKVFHTLLQARSDIIENSPSPSGGPAHQ